MGDDSKNWALPIFEIGLHIYKFLSEMSPVPIGPDFRDKVQDLEMGTDI